MFQLDAVVDRRIWNPEVRNFLRSSVASGHWNDGARMCYRILRSALRRRSQSVSCRWDSAVERPPILSSPADPSQELIGIVRLFHEVDSQCKGVFRLAGAGYHPIVHVDDLPDQEDRAAYHRLYWMSRYACAAALGHDRAFASLQRDWEHWLEQRWHHSSFSMAAYTMSERICSIAETLFWLDRTLEHEADWLTSQLEEQIAQDASALMLRLETHLGVHNHLLNNARALYTSSRILPHHSAALDWRATAFTLWDSYFPRLLLEDGTFDDQSSHYQLLLSRTALEYVLAARECGHALPDDLDSRVRSMFRLANDLLRPDGTLPRFGDSSPDHIVEELWGLLAAAKYHGLLEYPPRHHAVTPLTHYYCKCLPVCDPVGRCSPTSRTVLYARGGYGFLRCVRTGMEVAVHADPRADVRGHGNGGRGSFEVWLNGAVLIRQPGSFLNSLHPRFSWYRSGCGQNVTCLDGLAPGLDWETYRCLPEWYRPGGGQWEVQQDALHFRLDSFRRRRPQPIVVERSWGFTAPGTLLFVEHIDLTAESTDSVDLNSRICLGDAPWERETHESQFVLSLAGGSARMSIQTPPTVQILETPGNFIPEYGVERRARQLQLCGRVQPPFVWTLKLEALCVA